MFAIATEYRSAGPSASLTKYPETAWSQFFFAVSNGLRVNVLFANYDAGIIRRVEWDGKEFKFSAC